MTGTLGTAENPLRVAIVGSGPSGFYAADHLQRQAGLVVQIDMFDRLPTPYGLVRGGVAPDHQKIKSVTKAYDRVAAHPEFRFFGNINYGTDLTHADLAAHYHAVIWAVGAQSDRRMDIPGEDLPGSHPATEFVAWYNAHPDYANHQFDLSQESVAVVGLGNVAMDVIRILASSPEELAATDIADYALEALRNSRVKRIYVLGRRGPAQSAFTNPEIKELGELAEADVIVAPEEVALDPVSQQLVESGEDKSVTRNVEILKEYAARGGSGKPKQIIMRFCVSPTELSGNGHVQSVTLVKNALVADDKGNLKAKPTGETETLPIGLIFRSVGYNGVALPDVPFDARRGVIPNDHGRVLTAAGSGQAVAGEYVVGWIKRGPSGIIGTNKPDSIETADCLLADLQAGALPAPVQPDRAALESLLRQRGLRSVSYNEWLLLDEAERERGQERGAPRRKFWRVDEMLQAIDQRKKG